MKEMVLAFIFSPEMTHVLLIRKKKPSWQRGMLNGLGGKIEPGERPLAAIVREVREESGIEIHGGDFIAFGSMVARDDAWRVHLFAAVSEKIRKLEAIEHEEGWLTLQHVSMLPANIIRNLAWLIPKAKAVLTHGPGMVDNEFAG